MRCLKDTLKVKVTNDTDKPVTITYWVSVSEDGKFCEDSVRKAVPVIVNPYFDADAITVTPDKTKYCNGDSVTLTATVDEAMATTNPTFVWYNCEKCETPLQEETLENGGNIFTAENLVEGDTIFYVAVYNDEFCEDTLRQAIPVIVNPYFDAGEIEVELDTTKYCGGDDAVLTAMVDEAMAATNPTFVWYNCEKCATPLQEETLENGGNIFTAENLAVGDTIFYVAVYNDEFCEDTVRQAKTITVNPYSDGEGLIDASGSDTVICAETTTTLRVTAKDVVNPVFRWYATVDETEPFKEEQAETSTWETPVLTKDTTFYVTVEGDNYCEGKDKRKAIPVKVNQLPTFKLEIDGGNNATCSETDVTVRINAEEEDGLTNYVWMRDGGKLIAGGQSDDSYITVQWLVENQDAIKTIKLSYTDKNGCRPADSASIDVEVYSKVPAPLLEEITCNVVPAGTADIIVLSPLSTPEVEFQYALRIESIHAASEYGEFQVSPVFKDIPNGLHFVKAKNMVNNCESDSTEIKFIHCDCPVPPEVLWENYDNWLVGDTTCGVDPIERDLKYFGTASMVFIGSNGDGALHYVVGNDTTVIVDENMPVGVGTENNVPFTVIYTPVASDAFKTVRIIAITDNPAGGKCEPDEAFWDIEVRPYSDTALIDVDGIDIPYCDNGEGVEAAIFASYRSEDIVDPTFVWYDENNVAVDTTKTGEAFTPILTVENDSATVYTFKVSVFGNNYCESSEGKTVQVQVNPYSESGKIVVPNNGDTICVWDELEEFEITATYDGSIKDPVFVWYDKAGADGKELATGSPFKPEINRPTVQTTYTYYVSVYGEDYCEDSVRQKVQITVNPYSESGNIVVPNNGDTICVWDESGAFEITATYKGSIKNPVFVWYDKAGADGRELAAGNPFKPEVDRPTVQTTYTYYVSVYGDNYCEDSVRQEVQITVNPYSESGNIAVPNNGDTICVWDELGAFEITATYEGSIKDPVFVWYDKAGADGEVLATGSPFKPEIDRPTVQTTYTYYVSVYGENYCEDSVRQKVQITVNPYSESGKIVVPNNGDTICVWDELGAFEITATYEGSIKKPVFVWYDKAGADGEVLATGNPFKPEVDRPTVQTTYTYYVSVYGDNYCEDSVRQEVQITVNPYSESGKIAVPNNGDTICVWDELEAFEITATYEGSINNPVFVWYDKAGADGKVLATGNPFKPEVERPTVQTTYTYYVSVYGDNYCEDNTRQKVQITINPYAPDLFITVSGNVICADNVAKLTAKAEGVIKPVFRWYVDSNTENEVDPEAVVFDERSSTFTTDILFNDTVFYVTVEGENYCENKARTPVNVRVNPLSEWDPNIFDSIIVCAGEIVDVPDFTGTHLDSTKVRWRQIDPYTNRPNFNVGLKDSVGTGNIPVFATKSDIVKQEEMWIIATPVSEFNCVNLKEIDTVKIIVNPLPYPPVTYTVNILLDSLPQSIEGGVDATSSYHTLYWYVDKDSAGSLKAPVQPIQDEYNDTISYTYWVRFQSLAGCWSDFESVTVNIWRAFVPVHTPNTAICQYESIYLDDLAKASEYHELLWYTDYDAPKGTGSLEVPVVNTEKTGVYHFYVSQKNKNTLAESDKATIQISVIGVNTPVLSPELQLGYCAYDTAQVLEMFVDTIGYSYFIVPDSVELSEEKYQRYVDTVRDSRIKVYRDTLVWYMNGEKLLSDPTINTSVDTTTNYSFQVEEWYFIAYNADTLQKYWKDIYASEYYFVESGLHICKADTSFNIHVEQKLELHPSAPVIREGSPLELTAHPANSTGFFKWYENEIFLDSTQNETFRIGEFFESAVYTVSNEYCIASANVEVEIFVPNIMTPYNRNGRNDDFMIGSRSVVHVEIFNRYQQKVYEGNIGWDGTYRGRAAEPGTYYYRIQMKDGSVRKGTLEVAKF